LQRESRLPNLARQKLTFTEMRASGGRGLLVLFRFPVQPLDGTQRRLPAE
jgi:hypothetical protein